MPSSGSSGPLWYCDPDLYPIQRQDEIDAALERSPEVVADAAAFRADHERTLGIPPDDPMADDAKLAVYRSWKVLNAIDARARWRSVPVRLPRAAGPGAAEGTRTTGAISASSEVTVDAQGPAPEPMCPICLGLGTPIERPAGRLPSIGCGSATRSGRWTMLAGASRAPSSRRAQRLSRPTIG